MTLKSLGEQDLRIRERMRALVRSTMLEQGMTGRALARVTGVRESRISAFVAGTVVPDHEGVCAIAEALGIPSLVEMGLKLRTGRCEVCGTERTGSRVRPQFCGKKCSDVAGARRRRMGHGFSSVALVKHRLGTYQMAVVAMCRSCEPEGVCRDKSCALRPVSSLPLASRAVRVA